MSYKPYRFYYEVVECGRRVFLSGLAVLINLNILVAKVAATLVIAVFFLVVSESLAPSV